MDAVISMHGSGDHDHDDDDDDDYCDDGTHGEFPPAVSPVPAAGLQVAVPRSPRDGILVSFQTLTPAASSRVLENRRVRDEARAKAAAVRRAVREAKGAKAKVRASSQCEKEVASYCFGATKEVR